MGEARTTQAGVYQEQEGESLRTTQAGVYQDLDSESVRITQAGVYQELDPFQLRITQAGVYVEYSPSLDVDYIFVSYDNHDITEWVHSASLDAAINNIDVNDFASSAKESMAGMPKWKIVLQGHWDSIIDGYLLPEVIAATGEPKTAAIRFRDRANHEVEYKWTLAANIKDISVDAAMFDATKWQTELILSNAPERTMD